MNKDCKQRIIATKNGKRFHTAVEVFGKSKKKGMMARRPGFLKELDLTKAFASKKKSTIKDMLYGL